MGEIPTMIKARIRIMVHEDGSKNYDLLVWNGGELDFCIESDLTDYDTVVRWAGELTDAIEKLTGSEIGWMTDFETTY